MYIYGFKENVTEIDRVVFENVQLMKSYNFGDVHFL